MHFIQYYSWFYCIWDFNLNFCLKLKRGWSCQGESAPCPLNKALLTPWHIIIVLAKFNLSALLGIVPQNCIYISWGFRLLSWRNNKLCICMFHKGCGKLFGEHELETCFCNAYVCKHKIYKARHYIASSWS